MITFAQRQQDAAGLCLVGTAWLGGDKTGDVRGDSALDIQSGRFLPTRVASGTNSSAFGYSNTSSGTSSSAFGYNNTASGYYASSVGYNNTTLSLIHI